MRNPVCLKWFFLVVVGCCAPPTMAKADDVAPRSWAILIGAEGYHRATKLRFTVNDVDQLALTLRTRGGLEADSILKITDKESNPRFQPLRASILAELPKFLEQIGRDDTVFVYFSGHGFRDGEGRMYLAPLDCDPANAQPTAVSIQWFREQIASCKAKHKLLVLDSCHAGSEKGDDEDRVTAKALGEPFEDLAGVVTLASSTGDEFSQIWEEQKQSLFSFWLNQGLKGHADRDNDGAVDVDELYRYVYRRVTQSAKNHFPRPQTPVRIVRTDVQDVPTVVKLAPQTLKATIADIAQQLALDMQERHVERIGVLEFTSETPLGELLGADFGLLGKYCAEELEGSLTDYGGDELTIVDRRRLQTTLAKQGFTLDSLGSGEALEQLSKETGGLPLLGVGTLRSRSGRVVSLQCKLLATNSDEVAGMAAGVAELNPSEWAMLGRSARLSEEDRLPPAPGPDTLVVEPISHQIIERLDERATEGHPLADPDFPYRVRVVVNGKEHQPVFSGNDCYVGLSKGDIYQLWVENRSGEAVGMRLLVDGLNTMPESHKADEGKAMVVEQAARVNLDDANFWLLDPESITDPRKKKQWAIAGFFKQFKPKGVYHEFLVGDISEAPLARRQFTDQLGLISAAFYEPVRGGTRSMITLEGERREVEVATVNGFRIGDLLAVVHIHYVSPQELSKIARERR